MAPHPWQENEVLLLPGVYQILRVFSCVGMKSLFLVMHVRMLALLLHAKFSSCHAFAHASIAASCQVFVLSQVFTLLLHFFACLHCPFIFAYIYKNLCCAFLLFSLCLFVFVFFYPCDSCSQLKCGNREKTKLGMKQQC